MAKVRALMERGLAARAAGNLPAALTDLQAAYAALPAHWAVLVNYATVLQDVGRLPEAIAHFSKAAALSGEAVAGVNLGMAWLRAGMLAQGFRALLARWRTSGWPQAPYRLPCPHLLPEPGDLPLAALLTPGWRPPSLGSFVVMPDQGYGDTLQVLPFMRSLLRVRPETVVLVKLPLLEVARVALGDLTDRVYDRVEGRFGGWLTGFDIPAFWPEFLGEYSGERRVIATRLRAAFGADRLVGAPGGGIGVVWRGNPDQVMERWRRAGAGVLGAILRDLPGRPVCLLPDPTAAEGAEFFQGAGQEVELPPLSDFAATARVLSGCRALATVDTAVAHLAGLLGVPTLLLVNAFGDWRWGQSGSEVSWYPTVKACRQERPGQWPALVPAARQGLAGLLAMEAGAPI